MSDKTGTYPGDMGVGERMVFIYNSKTVEGGQIVSDVTYDRSMVNQILYDNLDEINKQKAEFERKMQEYNNGERKGKPKFDPNTFLSFIRQPFLSSFKIKETPETLSYEFMAVNAHLIYGRSSDRWKEFVALMNWIRDRVAETNKSYYPSFVLLGDLNLDYDNPERDIGKIADLVKTIDEGTANEIKVNFPFLDVHPQETEHFTSNVKLTERYDQIGLFFRDDDGENKGFPTKEEHVTMGQDPLGPDYGVFNFTELFAKALTGKSFLDLSRDEQKFLMKKYQHKVSDHM